MVINSAVARILNLSRIFCFQLASSLVGIFGTSVVVLGGTRVGFSMYQLLPEILCLCLDLLVLGGTSGITIPFNMNNLTFN